MPEETKYAADAAVGDDVEMVAAQFEASWQQNRSTIDMDVSSPTGLSTAVYIVVAIDVVENMHVLSLDIAVTKLF